MSDAEVPGGRRDFFDALADPLREGIRTGALPPGSFLPSEAELARAARTKRHSIRRALCRLREQGMIAPVAGRGWVVVGADSGASSGVPASAVPPDRRRAVRRDRGGAARQRCGPAQ